MRGSRSRLANRWTCEWERVCRGEILRTGIIEVTERDSKTETETETGRQTEAARETDRQKKDD